MTWDILKIFINKHRFKLLTNAIGVASDEIIACEQKLEIQLPQAYKDYIADVGVSFNFNSIGVPLGASKDFPSLIEFLPSKHTQYPQKLMFKIIKSAHNSMCGETLFLDLPNSNGYDVPLIEYDDMHPNFDPDSIERCPLTFIERLTCFTVKGLIPMTNELIGLQMELIIEVASTYDFKLIFPFQKNILFLQNELGKILIERDEEDEFGCYTSVHYEESIGKTFINELKGMEESS